MAANPNENAKRMVPPATRAAANDIPPMPTFEAVCPDLYRRFPELRNYDAEMKRWRESLKRNPAAN